jgi:hypothetical protein
MKVLYLFILLFSSASTYAEGFGGASGSNKLGEIFHLDQAGIYVQKNELDKKWEEDYTTEVDRFDISSIQEETFIIFNPSGKSPLAGVTYKVDYSKKTKNTCGKPMKIFQCIKGCEGRRVPQVFFVQPWEC